MRGVTVVSTTYFPPGEAGALRWEAFSRAVESWKAYLSAPNGLSLHIADDGSPDGDFDTAVKNCLESGWEVCASQQERGGVGASLNNGFKCAFDKGQFALYLVDDWELLSPFDLAPAMRLLENPSIGMVRLGPPHPDLTGTIKHDDPWYMLLDRHHFAFGHRPALYHPRMIEAYGGFDEGVNAYECEQLYNERFCASENGPEIVYAIPTTWNHVDSVELGDLQP